MKQDGHLRRDIIRWFGAALGTATLLPLVGCADDGGTGIGPDATPTGDGNISGACATIPEETAGPYPGDGSNGKNALNQTGIVRSDIRSSFNGASAVASGVPLTIKLKLVDTTASCATLAGYAIYLWHCDKDGNYSMYSAAVSGENYLRGVQETGSDGTVTFQTIFPGCYDGRMPHVHFEVYPSVAVVTSEAVTSEAATSSTAKVKTSQLGFPDAPCDEVYATSAYASSVTNYARITFATDNVFSDGTSLQIATVTGDVTSGYVATLQVGIAA
jgi:protocatechuate 3,4-dioxygenase beta subunit